MLKKYCGDVTIWTYPPPPMSPLVTILGYPTGDAPPVTSFLNDPFYWLPYFVESNFRQILNL